MPKSVKSSKKTGRKPALTPAQKQAKATYMHERSKLLKNIRSLEKRGYTVNINVPKIPVRSFEKATEKIRQLNEKRYERSSKTISRIVTDKKTGKDKVIQEKVKGTRAVKAERAQSARKAVEKRTINKQIKELEWVAETERINDIKSGHIFAQEGYIETQNKIRKLKGIDEPFDDDYEYPMTRDDWAIFNEYNGGYNPNFDPEEWYEIPDIDDAELDPEKEYFYNWETGEIADADELKSRGDSGAKWDVLSTMDSIERKYEKVMDEMDTFISAYDDSFDEGNEINDGIIDPSELKHRLQDMYEEDPYYFNDFMNMVEANPAYETPELYYLYGGTDYGKYAYVYEKAFSEKE